MTAMAKCSLAFRARISGRGVPPDILVEQSSADVVVREGANVSLACKARGYPTPSISWRREDGEPIPLGGYKQLTQQQQAANNKLHTLGK
ncbi:hypothetical protein BIW11_04169 [Tropilaelaps mercedesae]|uniref:Ig-like domain-containing protein n=1 Tax=Tropilaelaps mercedesae TaxID=418985 RepID=A0A1V9XA25_9ACAR|nr:hypothetical protein BIW11_04169 [Tropilaelaps mercedesae]